MSENNKIVVVFEPVLKIFLFRHEDCGADNGIEHAPTPALPLSTARVPQMAHLKRSHGGSQESLDQRT